MIAADAPWWGVAALSGGFALLGSVITVLLARAGEERRAQSQREEQSQAQLRNVCMDLLDAVDVFLNVSQHNHDHGQECPSDSFDGVSSALNRVSILAPQDIYDAATALVARTFDSMRADENDIKSMLATTRERWAYINLLRQYLGVETIELEIDRKRNT